MRGGDIRVLLILALIIVFQTFFCPAGRAAVFRVKPDGNDANSGASWALAKQTVSAAIQAATEGDEIWVAQGTYPEHIHNKVVAELAVNVALYGGFAGTEDIRDERDWQAHETILDGTGTGVVVTITDLAGPDTRIDGFTIKGGKGIHGGGIKTVASAPFIANNVIKLNMTDGAGAGVSCWGFNPVTDEQPIIMQNVITDNFAYEAEGDGAGIACVGSSPQITKNIIARNIANQNGGGICCWAGGDESLPLSASPTIANNFILANTANFLDGGSTNNVGGGGIFASGTDMTGKPIGAVSEPTIINNVIAANGGYLGGGITVVDSTSGAAVITNNTIVANSGSGIYWANTSPSIRNNVVAFNVWGLEQSPYFADTPTIAYNNVYGNMLQGQNTNYRGITDPTGSNGNISADPGLANHAIGEFHLQPSSPCVNAGDLAAVGDEWTDIDGQMRVVGSTVDIGADESDGTLWNVPTPIIYVSPSGDDSDGLTWDTAKTSVAGGILTAATTGGEVWVAAGTYNEPITIPAFVYLYGGFAGTETTRTQRNVLTNPTILDGGGAPPVVDSINAGYQASGLDGFTVQNGGVYTGGTLITEPTGVEGRGGGIRCRVASPIIANNTIRYNALGDPYSAAFGYGAGIYTYMSYPTIRGNTIIDNEILNTFDGSGGGIYCKLSMPYIEGNTLEANHAKYGSAIYCMLSSPKISRNTVVDNNMYYLMPLYPGAVNGAITCNQCLGMVVEENLVANNRANVGAGITVQSTMAGQIQNNLIVNNTTVEPGAISGGMGGGIYCDATAAYGDTIYIINNTLVDNIANGGFLGELGGGLAVAMAYPKITVANNVMAFNSSGIFRDPIFSVGPDLICNCVYNTGDNYINLTAGPTDIQQNALLVDRDGPDNDPATIADNDYHLTGNSPCIDTGDNAAIQNLLLTDFEGDPRIFDGDEDGNPVVDMGADELILNPCECDLNEDGKCDMLDWLLFGQDWGRTNCNDPGVEPCECDLNGDGTCDMLDWLLFGQDWGRTDCPIP
jgi:hypothetical protein